MPLERIEVEGFRSLVNFKIDLHRGLNILVGANGSGKTNFIKLLDFLAALTDNDLNVALRMAGGASEVFSKEQIAKTRPTLKISLYGSFPDFSKIGSRAVARRPHFESEGDASPSKFQYSLEIVYDKTRPKIFIRREVIMIHLTNAAQPIRIVRSSPLTNSDEVRIRASPKNNPYIVGLAKSVDYSSVEKSEELKFEPNRILEEHASEEHLFLLVFLHESRWLSYISSAISTFRSVNIDPGLAREPSPVGITYRISNKGEGLASIIQSLKKNRFYPFYRPNRFSHQEMYGNGQKMLEIISDWISEVNPNIVGIDVELEADRALLIAHVTMNFENIVQKFALNRLSDGTVKWIALVCTLITNEQNSVIEEPENFLHPEMQEVFVSLCESVSQSRTYFKEIVISTHSETLLNRCRPSDLIYFTYDEHGTQAHTPKNEEELKRLIKESHFGLGYFYRIGGVDV